MKVFVRAISLVFFVSLASAAGSDWVSFDVQYGGKEVGSCGKDKAPGDYMQGFDQMGVAYKVSDEVKDKSGKLESVTITKNAGAYIETVTRFYKSKKACEVEFQKRWTAKEKMVNEGKTEADKKYDSYQ